MKRRIAQISAVFAVALALVDTGYAQVTLAAIRGKVTDEQGAALPGATVTARHVATNTSKEVVTTDVGQYYLPNLPAGEYEVSIELTGFGTMRRTGIVLQVGQEIGLDFRMPTPRRFCGPPTRAFTMWRLGPTGRRTKSGADSWVPRRAAHIRCSMPCRRC